MRTSRAWPRRREGEVAGVSLSLPDFNQVLARLNGRLLPLGWLRALRDQRRIDYIRVFALGVKPSYQHTGVAAALYRDVWDSVGRRGMRGLAGSSRPTKP